MGCACSAEGPKKYTLVPWEEVKGSKPIAMPVPNNGGASVHRTDFQLSDRDPSDDDIFGETQPLNLTTPRQATYPSRPPLSTSQVGSESTAASSGMRSRPPGRGNTAGALAMEEYELQAGASSAPT